MSVKGIQDIYTFSGKPREIKLTASIYVLSDHIGNRKICVYDEAELAQRLTNVNFDRVARAFSESTERSDFAKKFGVCKAKLDGVTGFYLCVPMVYSGTVVENGWNIACLCMKQTAQPSLSSQSSPSTMPCAVQPQAQSGMPQTAALPTGTPPEGWVVSYDAEEIRKLIVRSGSAKSVAQRESDESTRARSRIEWAKSVWESISSTAYNSDRPYWENFSNGLFTQFSDQLRDRGIGAHVIMKLLSKTLCDSDEGGRVYVSYDKWLRFTACFWRGVGPNDCLIDWYEALSVTSASWFKGILSANQTENAFSGLPDGQFLLRYSDSMWMNGCIVFSVYRRGRTVNKHQQPPPLPPHGIAIHSWQINFNFNYYL